MATGTMQSTMTTAMVTPLPTTDEIMSAEVLDFCHQLGYWEFEACKVTRGSPRLLLDDIVALAKAHAWIREPQALADVYLNNPPAGLKHNYFVYAGPLPENYLLWGNGWERIRELVASIFTFVIERKKAHSNVIELDETKTSAALTATEQPHKVEATYELSVSTEISAAMDMPDGAGKGPLTRLARGDPGLIANLLRAGHTAGLPLVFRSKTALSDYLRTWATSHPFHDMPGSTAFYRPYVGKKHCYLKPIYFATTFEIVEVERFEISPTRMGWMLKDRDQSCMLVNNASANTGARRGYHGWLGADKGFSTLTIADNYGFNGSLESVKERVLASRTDSATTPFIKPEPSAFEARQLSLRRAKQARNIERSRRQATPPIASLNAVKSRPRWPPQYVSPPPMLASNAKKRRLLSSPSLEKNRSSLSRNSSSPEIVSAHSSRTGRVNRRASGTLLTPSPSPTKLKGKASPPKTPSRSTKVLTPPYTPSNHKTSKIRFNFFTSKEELGAVPATFGQCSTSGDFFDHAASALALFDGQTVESSVVGVNVLIEGQDWPMVLPWRNLEGFQSMMEVTKSTNEKHEDDLNVRVRCIMKC